MEKQFCEQSKLRQAQERVAGILLACLLILSTLWTLLTLQSVHTERKGIVSLAGYVPELVRQSVLLNAGVFAEPIKLLVSLHPRNERFMQTLAERLTRTAIDDTRPHMTPEEVAQNFAPDQSSRQAVIRYMQQAG